MSSTANLQEAIKTAIVAADRLGEILEGLSFKIKSGEKVAFVGESGTGKSTIVKLLFKFYTPEKGEVLVNKFNTKDLQFDAMRSRIAYIPQETFLFSGSIMDNLMFALDDPNTEEIIECAKLAQAHEFINELSL